jgi:mRNA interferase RelE/StbE
MADFQISFSRSARKELEALESNIVIRIFERIEALAKEPRPKGCRKIVGSRLLWRIRVGNYRVIYMVNDDKELIDIIAVRHRKDAYE